MSESTAPISPVTAPKNSPLRIAVLQPNKLGDVIVATPLLRRLREALPHARITLVLGPTNRAMRPLLGTLVDDVLDFSKRPADLLRFTWRARRAKFDWLIDLAEHDLKSSRWLVRLAGAKRSIGFAHAYKDLYDQVLPLLDRTTHHVADRLLTALGPLGVAPPADPHVELTLPPDAVAFARRAWPVADASPVVLINISGTGPKKFWGVANYAAFIAELRRIDPRLAFVLVGDPRDAAAIDELSAVANVPRLPVTSSFAEFAAYFPLADYVVTPDTSAAHLAAAWRKPCLGFYLHRPDGDRWTPYRSPHVMLMLPWAVSELDVPTAVDGFRRLVEIAATETNAGVRS